MIFDAHAHLFSRDFYAMLWKQVPSHQGGGAPTDAALRQWLAPLGIDLPPADPAEHATLLIAQLDEHGVDRMVIFTSLPGEQAAVAAAAKASAGRLVGYTMVNPRIPDAVPRARHDLTELDLRGIELFPAMHRFDPSDEQLVYPLYELAAGLGVPVFCHVGLLRVKLRERLGLRSPFDMRFSDPMLLHRAVADFPRLNFILPHFGCGYLREALLLGAACPNVYLDTSSSNEWMKLSPEPMDVRRALELAMQAFGPERILFGTDSSVLPRGYRYDVKETLELAMDELELSGEDRGNIMGGNLARLLPAPPE